MLNLQQEKRKNGEKHLSHFDMCKIITTLKQNEEFKWLYEVSNGSLQNVCGDLAKAYNKFFNKQVKHPKFKSKKKSKPNFPLNNAGKSFYFKDDKVIISKIGKVKYKTNYDIPQGRDIKFTNPRISYVNNKWIVSFGLECENQTPELTDKSMGIDLGVKELAIVAFGNEKIIFHNINKSKKIKDLEKKIKYLQKSISRKYRTNGNWNKSNNIIKLESKLHKLQSHLTNIRRNYTHQTTHYLVSLLPKRVVMEDLNVSGMMKNKHLSKSIQQQGFYEFIRQMKYKCEWNGIEFIQADRFYPSSKTCSCCGNIKKDLKLSDRVYICLKCKNVIDRDFNAAINLSRYVA